LKFKPASAVIFCGCGNNGGDGFVAARHLFNKGVSATVVIMNDPDKYTGDALTNLKIISKFKIKIKKWNYWKTDFCSPDIIIDGLLGTGFKGEVREPYASAIKKINSFDKPVVSIDVPSGLNADTGCSGGETVNASVTVTMAAVKKGCIAKSALKFCGKIIVADIGLPRNFL